MPKSIRQHGYVCCALNCAVVVIGIAVRGGLAVIALSCIFLIPASVYCLVQLRKAGRNYGLRIAVGVSAVVLLAIGLTVVSLVVA